MSLFAVLSLKMSLWNNDVRSMAMANVDADASGSVLGRMCASASRVLLGSVSVYGCCSRLVSAVRDGVGETHRGEVNANCVWSTAVSAMSAISGKGVGSSDSIGKGFVSMVGMTMVMAVSRGTLVGGVSKMVTSGSSSIFT